MCGQQGWSGCQGSGTQQQVGGLSEQQSWASRGGGEIDRVSAVCVIRNLANPLPPITCDRLESAQLSCRCAPVAHIHSTTHPSHSPQYNRPAEALADLDDDMLEDLVASYHFGGGGRDAGEGRQQQERGGGRPKSKKEVGAVWAAMVCGGSNSGASNAQRAHAPSVLAHHTCLCLHGSASSLSHLFSHFPLSHFHSLTYTFPASHTSHITQTDHGGDHCQVQGSKGRKGGTA